MSSKTKRILYITDQGMTLHIVHGRRLLGKRSYAPDEQGLDTFSRDLAEAPGLATQVLLDITEEEFHEERIPHVFSRDQKLILERKKNQRFRGRHWNFHEKQGREKTGCRDDLFLLSAITREALLDPWLQRLAEQSVPLERITSVPLLTSQLYRRLQLRHGHVLFVSHGEHGGIRQSFLINGKLKTSRLAPTPDMQEEEYVGLILSEVKRMQQFLISAFLLPQGESLHVYLLGSNQVQVLMGKALAGEPGIRLHNYNLQAIEEKLRYQGLDRANHADGLFALLLANVGATPAYTTFEDRRFFYHQRARWVLRGLAAAMLLAAFTGTGFALVRQAEIRDSLAEVAQRIGNYQRLHASLQARTPPGEVSGFQMKDAVAAYTTLQRMKVQPYRLLSQIGQALIQHPEVQLWRIDWQLVRQDQDLEQVGNLIEHRLEGQVQEVADKSPKASWVPALRLQGEVQRHAVSWRLLLHSFEQLVGRLGESDAISQVHVQRWPLEVRPEKALVLDETRQQEDLGSPFTLILMGREQL